MRRLTQLLIRVLVGLIAYQVQEQLLEQGFVLLDSIVHLVQRFLPKLLQVLLLLLLDQFSLLSAILVSLPLDTKALHVLNVRMGTNAKEQARLGQQYALLEVLDQVVPQTFVKHVQKVLSPLTEELKTALNVSSVQKDEFVMRMESTTSVSQLSVNQVMYAVKEQVKD